MATELMQWCNDRWLRKITTENVPAEYRKQYRPSPRALRKRYPDLVTALTRDGSRKAANQYWHDLQAEIRAKTVKPTLEEMMVRNPVETFAKMSKRKQRETIGMMVKETMVRLAPSMAELDRIPAHGFD